MRETTRAHSNPTTTLRPLSIIMSLAFREVIQANDHYASDFGDRSRLHLPPSRKFAVLTCMDARIDPAKLAGLSEGDAHVIRNAGGRASDDALRSLVISYKLLGTKEFFVIHHTNCGMALFTDEVIRDLLASSLDQAELDADGWKDLGLTPGSKAAQFTNFLTFKDETQSVVDDVLRIRQHPLIPGYIPVYGFVYDVKTGRLIEVEEATRAGARLDIPPDL